MAARSKARRRALDILFESDLRETDPVELLAEVGRRRAAMGLPPLNEYVGQLVLGYARNREQIDQDLATYSIGWTLDRMPRVDRCILRLASAELIMGGAPRGVVLSEAVELATQLSTDDSPRFVNGLLSRIADLHADAS